MCLKKKKNPKKPKSEIELNQIKKQEEQDKEKNKIVYSNLDIYKYCFKYTKQNWKIIAACQLISQIPTFIYGYQIQSSKGFENAASKKDKDAYLNNILLFVVIEIITFLMVPITTKLQAFLKLKMSGNIKTEIFNKVIELDHDYHSKYEQWEILSIPQSGETYMVQYITFNTVKQKFESVYRAFVQIQILYAASAKLTYIFLALLPFKIIYSKIQQYDNKIQNEKAKTRQQKYQNVSLEMANGMEAVKIGTAEKLVIEEYIKYKNWTAKQKLKGFLKGIIYQLCEQVISKLHTFAILYVFYEKVMNKEQILTGDITSCLGYIYILYQFYEQVMQIKKLFFISKDDVDHQLIEANKVMKLIHYEPKIHLNKGKTVQSIKGKVEFKNVTFQYPKSELKVLQDISLVIEAGSYVAFSGKSGTGKSTIITLIQRFFDPQQGDIFIDGQNIKDMNIFEFRQKLGIVNQKSVLYNMTIKENILFGCNREVSDAEIEEICKTTGIDSFINDKKKFPKGIQTRMGWQRKTKREKLEDDRIKREEEEKKKKEEEQEKKDQEKEKSGENQDEIKLKNEENKIDDKNEENESLISKDNKQEEKEIKKTEEPDDLDEPYEPTEKEQQDHKLTHTNRELSGGQKQLVAIARALIRKPQMLILDEATSNLDSKSEHVVQECINNILQKQKGITVIVIAHRLSTIANCQKIFVIEEGKLVEQGPHSELYLKKGAYWNLVKYEIEGTQLLIEKEKVKPQWLIDAIEEHKIKLAQKQIQQIEEEENTINLPDQSSMQEKKLLEEELQILQEQEKFDKDIDIKDVEDEDLGDISNFILKKAFSTYK